MSDLGTKNIRVGDFSQQMSPDVIRLRREWLNFSDEDQQLVREIDDLMVANIDAMMDDMYAHFLAFDETRRFFPDEATLSRAQNGQKHYFLRMTKGNYDAQYVAERLSVGLTHYRIGLDPTWYLGAYNRVMTWLRRLVHDKYQHDQEKYIRTVSALTRVIFFDMGLAIESYSLAKEWAIRAQRDEIAELETSHRVTRSLLDAAPSGIVWLSKDFDCLACSEQFVSLTGGKSRDTVVGQNLFALAPSLPTSTFEAVLESGEPILRSADMLSLAAQATSQHTFYDWAIWPVRGQGSDINGLIAIFTDVTARVLLYQQREDFVATLTHDLKTPILAANRAIKLLLEGDFGQIQDPQRQILETIHDSNRTMYNMVQTLLDVYRYDSGAKEMQFARHDLPKMIDTMIKELNPLARAKGVEIRSVWPEDSVPVCCDIDEIRRVMQNLLDNALKFTTGGGTITIEMTQSAQRTEVSVSDTGKGIAPADLPKLFQRFWAPSSSGRYHASTGLGLYLCRKIVELHKGRIWCDSEPGKGSVFHFTMEVRCDE